MQVGSATSASNAPPNSSGSGAATQLVRDQQRLAVDTTAKANAVRLNADKQAVTRDRQAVSRNAGTRLDRYV
jgi:hypothetical protein